MKKAIVIGATGMVGTQLVKQLLASDDYKEVVTLVRHSSGIVHSKLNEKLIDFDHPTDWSHFVTGDVLFSCLGITLPKAGNKASQYKVDYFYQYKVAEIAAQNNVSQYVLVSSMGANAHSANFYLKMKGELDEVVKNLPFQIVNILRPGQLDGARKEFRLVEKIGLTVMKAMNSIGLLQKYKPILDCQVASAMIRVVEKAQSGIYTLDELFRI